MVGKPYKPFPYRIIMGAYEYKVKIHAIKNTKKLKDGSKEYEYGSINIQDKELVKHAGKEAQVVIKVKKS